ncbi:MAG: GtrA family protein [Ruthenibacterium lactatiformans]
MRGERYEYELNMLIYAKQRSIPYTIVPIETVYFNNNEGSHYRTVADSARIIHQLGSGLVQYAMSAGLSVVVDVFVYCVLVKWLLLGLPLAPRLFFAAVIARTLSSVVNYTCNRRLPYVQNKKIGPTVAKYYCLWLAQLMLSFVGVWMACTGCTWTTCWPSCWWTRFWPWPATRCSFAGCSVKRRRGRCFTEAAKPLAAKRTTAQWFRAAKCRA